MVVPKAENDQPISQTIARLATVGIPTARARFLIRPGPQERGTAKMIGMDFAKVASPAQTPLYAPGRTVRANSTKSTAIESNIPQIAETMMLKGEKSQTFMTNEDLSEPLLST